jgi:hypothetical protein
MAGSWWMENMFDGNWEEEEQEKRMQRGDVSGEEAVLLLSKPRTL